MLPLYFPLDFGASSNDEEVGRVQARRVELSKQVSVNSRIYGDTEPERSSSFYGCVYPINYCFAGEPSIAAAS